MCCLTYVLANHIAQAFSCDCKEPREADSWPCCESCGLETILHLHLGTLRLMKRVSGTLVACMHTTHTSCVALWMSLKPCQKRARCPACRHLRLLNGRGACMHGCQPVPQGARMRAAARAALSRGRVLPRSSARSHRLAAPSGRGRRGRQGIDHLSFLR